MPPDPSGDDILGLAIRVGKALDAIGARYMLVGSVASSLLGDPRTTNDVDFVTALRAAQVARFCAALGEDFDVDQQALSDAMASGGSWNIFYSPWMSKIDLFSLGGSEFHRSQLSRSVKMIIGADQLNILRADDTVLSKLLWYRDGGGVSDQQWRDVLGVLRVSATSIDYQYLREWGARLGIQALLEKALGEVGSRAP